MRMMEVSVVRRLCLVMCDLTRVQDVGSVYVRVEADVSVVAKVISRHDTKTRRFEHDSSSVKFPQRREAGDGRSCREMLDEGRRVDVSKISTDTWIVPL